MSALKTKSQPLEIRGPERAFQYDRDTIIIYTGMHRDDVRPFIRIGAGDSTPFGLVPHIENVVLPDLDPVNVGLELYWLHTTLERGGDMIRYVGSKDQVNRLYSFSGMREIEEAGVEETHVEKLVYRPLPPGPRVVRDRCLINFFETGNVNVSVDGARVLDLQARKRAFLNLDREYEMIARAMRRRTPACSEGFSFMALAESRTSGVAMFWNFEEAGMLINPPRDFHYRLFEKGINPDRVNMCIAASAFQPGFTESIRRRNSLGADIAVFALNGDKLPDLKKIYARAAMRVLEDSRALPYARSTTFFASRTGSHGLFCLQFDGNPGRQVQVQFPISPSSKPNRSFEFMKGPHDLEIGRMEAEADWSGEWSARLVLVDPGPVAPTRFARLRLKTGLYPLVPGMEYSVIQVEQAAGLIEMMLESVADTAHEDLLRELVLMTLGLEFAPERVAEILRSLVGAGPSADPDARSNTFEVLRFLESLPQYAAGYDDRLHRLLEKAQARFGPSGVSVGQWLALSEKSVRFVAAVLGSRKTFHLVLPTVAAVVRLRMPPNLDELALDPKEYRRSLNRWSKTIARAADPAGYDDGVEFLERLYEERLRLLEERTRLRELVARLGMEWAPPPEDLGPAWLPPAFLGAYKTLHRLWSATSEWFGALAGRFR